MHMHHHLGPEAQMDPVIRKKAQLMLASIVVPLLVLTVVGLFLLYPGDYHQKKTPYLAKGVTRAKAVVVNKPITTCKFNDIAISADLLKSAVCAKITEGKGTGQVVPVHLPPENKRIVKPGTKLKLFYDPSAVTQGTPYIFEDIERTFPILWMTILYLALVVIVAGKRGAAALVGLVTSCLVIFFFILPALMAGKPALLVTLVGAGAMMFLSVYLAHGITIRTTTALFGTFIGLAVTMGLATVGVDQTGLSGATSDDALNLMTYFPNISLTAMLMCGIVIAGLGALNDVAITQASAVWELFEANPTMPPTKLFSRAMRIGRDHIASTVYTLAFAYAGTALPTFIIASMIDRPIMDLALSSSIAEEIVRTLVASIGLVLAIPATTVIGTFLVTWIHISNKEDYRFEGHSHDAPAHSSHAEENDGDEHAHEERISGEGVPVNHATDGDARNAEAFNDEECSDGAQEVPSDETYAQIYDRAYREAYQDAYEDAYKEAQMRQAASAAGRSGRHSSLDAGQDEGA